MKQTSHPFSTDHFLHGGDYNPDQWLDRPDILEKDLEYFEKAGINCVSLGIFSWAMLEPEEGHYQFDWMKEIIDRLYSHGISIDLATPSGARPHWLADAYPEVLRVDENRRRALFGERHNHCYTSPAYRQKVYQINRKLAETFGDHPGVILWHISNEYGGECHCPLCQEQFRAWLKDRYHTIDHLNKCWNTAFWSHIYQNFDQIESPSPIGEWEMHGLKLDWKRFVTHQTRDFMRWEIQALRDGGTAKPVTTNFMYDYQGLDYSKFADDLDVISWDNYPTWHKEAEIETAWDCGLQHDQMRSYKGQPFLLMESSPSATNWQPVSKLRKPGMLKLASLQAVAHGSDSVLYFQIRQSRGASEKFHGAVIDHYGGEDSRVFQEVCDLGRTLKQLKEAAGSNTPKQAAILCDTESRWAMEDAMGPRNQGLPDKKTIQGFYSGLRQMGLNVDILDETQTLEGYRLVIAPMLYMFKHGIQEKLRSFTADGGTLVMTFWSGLADEHDLCFLGGTPGGLTDVLGLRFMEIDGLYDWESNTLIPIGRAPASADGVPSSTDGVLSTRQAVISKAASEMPDTFHPQKSYTCHSLCELVYPTTAKTLMAYGSDFYKGYPALTCNSYEKGKAYYLCAAAETAFYQDFLKALVIELFPERPVMEIPYGVEVTTRQNDSREYLFLQNFTRETTAVSPSWHDYECLTGSFSNSLEPYETVVLARNRS